MTCPHCHKEIPADAYARSFASKGGSKSKRTISPEAQAKLQEAGKRARERRKGA